MSRFEQQVDSKQIGNNPNSNGNYINSQSGNQGLNAVTFGYRRPPSGQNTNQDSQNVFQVAPIEEAMQQYLHQNGQPNDPAGVYNHHEINHQNNEQDNEEQISEERVSYVNNGQAGVEVVEEDDDEEGAHEHDNEDQQNKEDEYEEEEQNEEDEEEDNREELICLHCSKQVEQALVLACDHRLCLDCAAAQYIIALRSAGLSVNNSDLLSTIDCQACGIATPLTKESIAVLLSIEIDTSIPIVNDQSQTQQISTWQLNDSFSNRNDDRHQESSLQQVQQPIPASTLQQQQGHSQDESDEKATQNQQDQQEQQQQVESIETQQAQQQSTFLSQQSLTLSQSHVQNLPHSKKSSQPSFSPNFQPNTINSNELPSDEHSHPPPFIYYDPQQQQQYLQEQSSQEAHAYQQPKQPIQSQSLQSNSQSTQNNFSPQQVFPQSQQQQFQSYPMQLKQQQQQYQQSQNEPAVSQKQQNQQYPSQQGKIQSIQQSAQHKVVTQTANSIDSAFQSKKPANISLNNTDQKDQRILFCFTCQTLCFTLDEYLKGLHRNHIVKDISKSYEELQEPIEELLGKLKGKKDELIQDESRLNMKAQDLNASLEEYKNKIKQSFKELVEALGQKERELLTNLDETAQESSTELNKCRDIILGNINVVDEFAESIQGVYHDAQRDLNSQITAFDYYAENKIKIIQTIDQINCQLSSNISDKLAWEFQMETDSLYHHIESIKPVKVQIARIQHSADLKQQFYQRSFNEDKSKQLLENILTSKKNLNNNLLKPTTPKTINSKVETRAYINSSDDKSATNENNKNYNIISNYNSLITNRNYKSFVGQEALYQSGASNNSHNSSSGNIYKSSPATVISPSYLNSQQQQQRPTEALSQRSSRQSNSPRRFIKIRGEGESILEGGSKLSQQYSFKRQQRTQINKNNNSNSRNSNTSHNNLTNINSISQHQLANKSNNSQSFKTFSINSPSAKQEFASILSGQTSIAKNYYKPSSYEKLILHAGELSQNYNSPLSHFQLSSSVSSSSPSSSLYSKIGVLDAIRKSNNNVMKIEENKRKSLPTEESLSSLKNYRQEYVSRSTNELATISAQNRIRHLQQKLISKYH